MYGARRQWRGQGRMIDEAPPLAGKIRKVLRHPTYDGDAGLDLSASETILMFVAE
jgi:hypothetical protein